MHQNGEGAKQHQSGDRMAGAILAEAVRMGFDAVGIASAAKLAGAETRLRHFLEQGWHGEMGWLARQPERRAHPEAYWPEAKSVIVVGLSYASGEDGLDWGAAKEKGWIASFARREDYHPVLKARLGELAAFMEAQFGGKTRVCVDDAPVMEKPLAALAGLGWQGKHSNLVSRKAGSWLFLGACLTSLPLPQSKPHKDYCGSCSACMEICPTAAIEQPYRLNAQKCISYLTIEHKTHIPQHFRTAIGNRIFGCDDCLLVCPWNKFAEKAGNLRELAEQEKFKLPSLTALASLDEDEFRSFFAETGFLRLGFTRFQRNLMIVLGNSGEADYLPLAKARLTDASPYIRAAAIWACKQLAGSDEFAALAAHHAAEEQDSTVRGEWEAG